MQRGIEFHVEHMYVYSICLISNSLFMFYNLCILFEVKRKSEGISSFKQKWLDICLQLLNRLLSLLLLSCLLFCQSKLFCLIKTFCQLILYNTSMHIYVHIYLNNIDLYATTEKSCIWLLRISGFFRSCFYSCKIPYWSWQINQTQTWL